ncbi:MAG TPA: alpha/beta hydrolase [Caulobacteraceae bacterium]|nr:alpha/beta hydrolase [Caulobacteraceae bacterium]
MFVEVNGARLFFDTVGAELAVEETRMAGRRHLLVLHGGPGFDHSILRPWFDRFADAFQVVFLDHRGNGRSDGARETWRLSQWADDIRAFCDTLGIERPIVYGLSFGGMVAQAYASRHPDHPERVVLASTAAVLDLPATYAMMGELGGEKARRIAETFWSAPTPEGAAEYLQICMPLYNPTPDASAAAARARAIMRLEVMFDFIQGEQRSMDLRPGLSDVRCPVLITAGALDPITPLSCSQAILAALPDGLGRLEVFEEAGHGVHRDNPERAEASLRRFFAEGERA